MLPSFLLATFLATLGGGLLMWHFWAWRTVQDQQPGARELAFSRRKFRRRRRVGVLIVLLGGAIAGGDFVRDPLLGLAYWCGTLFLVLWIVGLALLDMAASQQHLGLQRAKRDAEEAILLRQFHKDFSHRQNGHPPTDETRSEP